MLKYVPPVRDAVCALCESAPIDLESISKVVSNFGFIDRIEYIGYDCDSNNPILGSFRKFEHRPSPYSSIETTAEIRYANHLSDDWRRIVVCKELCHAIDRESGEYSLTEGHVESLVEAFSLRSTDVALSQTPELSVENIAEAGAIEILCPLHMRRELLSAGDNLDLAELQKRFGIPQSHLDLAFNQKYVDQIGLILGE